MKYLSLSLSPFIGALILVFSLLSCSQSGSNEEKNTPAAANTQAAAASNELPKLTFTTLEGQQLTLNEDYKGKPILVLFQPECEDCQREAKQIADNMEAFEGHFLYFVSSAPKPQIAAFAEHFKLNDYQNVVFAQTTVQEVINNLGPVPAPSVFIFSEEGKLIKTFKGEVGIEKIMSAL